MHYSSEQRWRLLSVLAALCAAVVFGIPARADEPGCKTSSCTSYDAEGHAWGGHCGAWDEDCGCFQSVGGGGQQQSACRSEKEGG